MKIPNKIFITKNVQEFLIKRNIYKQFLKSKNNILQGRSIGGANFKKKEPKEDEVWYFRINKQYRAIGEFNAEGNFVVMAIDNHQ